MTSERSLHMLPRGKPRARRFRFGTFEIHVELDELRESGAALPLHVRTILGMPRGLVPVGRSRDGGLPRT